MRRSKSFIADKYFPPFALKEGNLKGLLAQREAFEAPADSQVYMQWQSKLLEIIPRLNHDITVELALNLAYDAKVNDKVIWRAIEDASIASLHHMTLTQVCQLEWATMELKPK